MSAAGKGQLDVAELSTITTGVLVRKPDWEAAPPTLGPGGGVSMGPQHLSGIGPVLTVALHSPEGETVLVQLNAHGFAQFGAQFNAAARRIMAGEFDAPAVIQ